MPENFKRCVKHLLKKGMGQSSYPICRKSTGYYGTTHEIGLLHPVKSKRVKNW